ncbi:MAG: HlyD family efflux transporter periplasmic adaptor subunit [Pirellulaceae bacterium]
MNQFLPPPSFRLVCWSQTSEVPRSNNAYLFEVRAIEELDDFRYGSGSPHGNCGDRRRQVTVGQLVAKTDATDAELAKAGALSSYNAAKNSINESIISREAADKAAGVSLAEYDKAREANAEVPGAFSDTEVKRLKLQWERAVLQIQLAESQTAVATYQAKSSESEFRRAEAQIERRELKSEVNGIVDKVHFDKGEWVMPQDKVMTIVRMDRLRVHGRFSPQDYSRSDLHRRPVEVVVTLAGSDGVARVNGQIGYVSPKIDHAGDWQIWVEIENKKENGLWLFSPGMMATVELK